MSRLYETKFPLSSTLVNVSQGLLHGINLKVDFPLCSPIVVRRYLWDKRNCFPIGKSPGKQYGARAPMRDLTDNIDGGGCWIPNGGVTVLVFSSSCVVFRASNVSVYALRSISVVSLSWLSFCRYINWNPIKNWSLNGSNRLTNGMRLIWFYFSLIAAAAATAQRQKTTPTAINETHFILFYVFSLFVCWWRGGARGDFSVWPFTMIYLALAFASSSISI